MQESSLMSCMRKLAEGTQGFGIMADRYIIAAGYLSLTACIRNLYWDATPNAVELGTMLLQPTCKTTASYLDPGCPPNTTASVSFAIVAPGTHLLWKPLKRSPVTYLGIESPRMRTSAVRKENYIGIHYKHRQTYYSMDSWLRAWAIFSRSGSETVMYLR